MEPKAPRTNAVASSTSLRPPSTDCQSRRVELQPQQIDLLVVPASPKLGTQSEAEPVRKRDCQRGQRRNSSAFVAVRKQERLRDLSTMFGKRLSTCHRRIV